MITRRKFATLTLAIAALGLAGSAYIGWGMHKDGAAPSKFSHAAWKVKFNAPSDLPQGVDAVVLATAISAVPGRVAVSQNGEDSLPFEEVTFQIVRGMKGLRAGDSVIVERAGGVDYEGHTVLLDADGGPFQIGSTYLLFLNRQEDGPFYYQVNDQGRFKVEGDLLVSTSDDPVAEFFDGKSLDEGAALIAEYLGRKPSNPPGRQND